MREERQKLFQELVQVMAKVMVPETLGGGSQGSAAMGRSAESKVMEQTYGPAILEQLDRMRNSLCDAEDAVERLYAKTERVTYPEPANQALTSTGDVERVLPQVADELLSGCRRVERLTARLNYLIARIGL